jgi:hypothetical protein
LSIADILPISGRKGLESSSPLQKHFGMNMQQL